MNPKVEIVLRSCFRGEAMKLSKGIAESLFDERALKIIQTAESIADYIDVQSVISKLKDEYFKAYFSFENINSKIVRAYLIDRLSWFSHFTYGSKSPEYHGDDYWSLKFDGQNLGLYGWKKITGHESYHDYAHALSETMLYFAGYEKSRSDLKNVGIITTGAGSVADYIRKGIVDIKPAVLETIQYLSNL